MGDDDRLVVALAGVTRVFQTPGGPVTALKPVTLTVMRGEAVALMGPSGSGKTTLLNIVAGLDRPTAGSVTVLGTSLATATERQLTAFRGLRLGIVFQEAHLLPGLTALQNVVIARLPWGDRRTLEPRARDLLARVGLADRGNFLPARLSEGERQRVGLARALLGDPQLLLADEPTGNLDSATTEDLLGLLEELRRERTLTMVIATHDAAVAAAAGRQLRLNDGGLEATTRRGFGGSVRMRILD
jgi:ABC-type lipoprotein export system ATPase subunit